METLFVYERRKISIHYDYPLTSKFLKVIYSQHPTLPRYLNIWGINVLSAYFESLPANSKLTLKCLTKTLAVLLLILSKQRKQALFAIDTDVKVYENKLSTVDKLNPELLN